MTITFWRRCTFSQNNRGSRISFKNDEPYGHRSCALTIGFCYTGGRSVVGKLGHDETHVTRQSRIANQPQPKLEIDVPPMGLT